MFVQVTEMCLRQVALIEASSSMIGVPRRLCLHMKKFMTVKFFLSYHLTINYFVLDHINCVRWDPSKPMTASASWDMTTQLLDVRSGQIIYSGTTSDQSKYC
mgnify:CR=1 FL=1